VVTLQIQVTLNEKPAGKVVLSGMLRRLSNVTSACKDGALAIKACQKQHATARNQERNSMTLARCFCGPCPMGIRI
jgi:hypothetical protein